jgi:hypothetical protein
MRRSAAIACLALLVASPAAAEEAVTTAGSGAPLPAAEGSARPISDPAMVDPQADGSEAGARSGERPGCRPPPDRKPHGEVWAAIGTGGYRSVGGVVTQPIGDCGFITIVVSHAQGRTW